jgi:hypothetical protein
MESLFEKQTSQRFIDRIHLLTPQTQSQWGRMNVAQMLAHCQVPLKVASGELVPRINPLIRLLFGKSAKRQLTNEPEFRRNIPTFREARITDRRVFETERNRLVEALQDFQRKGPAGLTKKPHPFFGEMSTGDWDLLQVKHLDHHLRQFGI